MSAFGPKRTSLVALHMSAFGGKADICSRTSAAHSLRQCRTVWRRIAKPYLCRCACVGALASRSFQQPGLDVVRRIGPLLDLREGRFLASTGRTHGRENNGHAESCEASP